MKEQTISNLKKLKSFHNGSYGADINRAIQALEQQPCEDCISRAKALEMLGDEPENWTDTEKEIQEVNDYRWFKSILEELPPVTPQPKVGKWIKEGEEEGILGFRFTRRRCSKCGWTHGLVIPKNYCPNCGSYNGGDEDGRKSTD